MGVYLESVVCYQVEISASGWSLVQRSPAECRVSACDHQAPTSRRPWPNRGCHAMGGGYIWGGNRIKSVVGNSKYGFPAFRFLKNQTCLRVVYFQHLLRHAVSYIVYNVNKCKPLSLSSICSRFTFESSVQYRNRQSTSGLVSGRCANQTGITKSTLCYVDSTSKLCCYSKVPAIPRVRHRVVWWLFCVLLRRLRGKFLIAVINCVSSHSEERNRVKLTKH